VRAFPPEVDGSWIERKNAENALKAAQAKRQLELLQAQDVEVLKKRQSVQLRAGVERSMVAIEKAHDALKRTGNVPGFVPGHAETVVSEDGTVLTHGVSGSESSGPGTPCTISPDSSASQHDFRVAVKKIADQEVEIADQRAENAKLTKELQRMGQFRDLEDAREVVFTDNGAASLKDAVAPSVREKIDALGEYRDVEYIRDVNGGGIRVISNYVLDDDGSNGMY